MAVSEEFLEYMLGQFADWGGVAAKKMFGGAGLFRDGKMFALIADDMAYLKVDDTNREPFIEAGSLQFKPYEKRPAMPYFEIPSAILENPADLIEWGKRALAIHKR
jgi:DNA transformation protein and related proteins